MRGIIKKILKEGDFDWVNDEPINPFYDYDGIIFDMPITHKVISNYIDMALIARPDINNPNSWDERNHDIFMINHFINDNGEAYLTVSKDDKLLSYGDDGKYWYHNEKWVRYSDLINGVLNESDDMQWIEDIKPSRHVPFDEAVLGVMYGVLIDDELAFLKAIGDCDEEFDDIDEIDHVVVYARDSNTVFEIYCDAEGQIYWEGSKECLQIYFYDKNDRQLLTHWFAPDHLIELQHT
jgi:hypothetical protein